eukprot:scaffold144986_cov28-Tisochrysis_lutea.AAC.4
MSYHSPTEPILLHCRRGHPLLLLVRVVPRPLSLGRRLAWRTTTRPHFVFLALVERRPRN